MAYYRLSRAWPLQDACIFLAGDIDRPVQQNEPVAVLRACEKPGDAELRHCLHGKAAWLAHDLKIRLFEKRRGTRTIGNASDDCRRFGYVR